MIFVDYLLIAILLVSVIIGALRGFLREAIALVSWILALFLAWQFAAVTRAASRRLARRASGHAHLGGARAHRSWPCWSSAASSGALLGHFVRLSLFSGLDRLLGFFFGLLRGLVVLGLLVILGQLLRIDAEPWWEQVEAHAAGERIANGLRAIVGEHWPPDRACPVKV